MTADSQTPKITVPIQKEIDPFHANAPAFDTNTATAMTSVTTCQMLT